MNGRRGITIVRAILPVGVLVAAATILYLKPGNNEAPKGPPAAAPALYGFMGAAGGEQSYAPGRLLVQIREGAMETTLMDVPLDKGRRVKEAKTGLKGLDDLAQNAGVTGISRPYDAPLNRSKAAGSGVDRWFMFHFADVKDLPGLADAFAALDEVQAVSLDWRAFPSAVPTDPGFADNWGHENRAQLPAYNPNGSHSHTGDGAGVVGFDADLPQAWEGPQGYGSASVVIAIIDSGVDTDHADLRLVTGYDFGDDDADPDDNAAGAGHGTACAGVAAALNNGIGAVGVAPGCSIMPLKVAESDGYMYFSAVQNALYYAADHGAHIVSMSFGAPLKTDAATEAALQYADAAGVVLLAATGNGNKGDIQYPAASPYVIAVGAASPGGDRKRSSSLSQELNAGVSADPRGPTCDGERWWGSSYGAVAKGAADAVDLLGPTILPTCDIMGSGGYSAGDVEPFFNGTSCATPYVAGVAALILSAFPDYTPAEVRELLVSSARDVVNDESEAGWDRFSGSGLVNAGAAVGGAAPVTPIAAFTTVTASGSAPLEVAFTDASTGAATAWAWDFGDGSSSTEQSPSHLYAEAGVYDVSLTVTNEFGSNTATQAGCVSVAAAVAVAAAAVLQQNQPNPFNPVTQVAFNLPRDCNVRLTIYNTRGQQVAVLAEGSLSAGNHSVTWDATGQPSGVYFCRLEGPGINESRKMTLLK
jgi:subtilisin family serine protease